MASRPPYCLNRQSILPTNEMKEPRPEQWSPAPAPVTLVSSATPKQERAADSRKNWKSAALNATMKLLG